MEFIVDCYNRAWEIYSQQTVDIYAFESKSTKNINPLFSIQFFSSRLIEVLRYGFRMIHRTLYIEQYGCETNIYNTNFPNNLFAVEPPQ